MAAGIIAFVLFGGLAVGAGTISFGYRIFTRDFWRPGPALRSMAMLWRQFVQLVGMLVLMAFGVAAALGMIYLLIWIIHAMWRAT